MHACWGSGRLVIWLRIDIWVTMYNTICHWLLELVNLIHLVQGCSGVVVSMLVRKTGDAGPIPVRHQKFFFISGYYGSNLLPSLHRGEENTLPQFQQGSGPVTSYVYACSGSDRYVIQLGIDIWFTMYWEISRFGSPCPADQKIRRVIPLQQYRWSSHSVKIL